MTQNLRISRKKSAKRKNSYLKNSNNSSKLQERQEFFSLSDFSIDAEFSSLSYKQITQNMSMLTFILTAEYKAQRVARYVLKQIMGRLSHQHDVAYVNQKTIANSIYTDRHVKRGLKLLKELGIVTVFNKGFKKCNTYQVNFELLQEYCLDARKNAGSFEGTSAKIQIKEKELNKEESNSSAIFRSMWQEPEPFKDTFALTEEEFEFIKHNFRREKEEIELAVEEFKKYNAKKVGFRWFNLFIDFCKKRDWDWIRKREERKSRRFSRYYSVAYDKNARIRSAIALKAAKNQRFNDLIKPKLKEPTETDLKEIMLEMELTDSFERSLNVSRAEATRLAKAQIWRERRFGTFNPNLIDNLL